MKIPVRFIASISVCLCGAAVPVGAENTPDPVALHLTKAARPYVQALAERLPAAFRIVDPADSTVVEPTLREFVEPRFRPPSGADALELKFIVAVVVKADGSADDAFILSSTDPSCDGRMLAALRKWKFSPGTVDGERAAFLFVTDYGVSGRRMR